MIWLLKAAISLLLLVNGSAALWGGYQLMVSPDGSSLGMPVLLLQHSPFTDYFIPGLILFITNGLSSISILLLFLYRAFVVPVIFQGIILTGWVVVQILLLHTLVPLQLGMGAMGILMIILGWVFLRLGHTENSKLTL